MFGKILVATDNSQISNNASAVAGKLFPTSAFHILSVIDTSEHSAPRSKHLLKNIEKESALGIEHAKERLKKRGVKHIASSVKSGTPSKEIIRLTREKEIELIVMGTQSKSGSQRVEIGQTCALVLEYTKCPVLLFPKPVKIDKPVSILNPTSGSKYSMGASEMAILIAEHFGAKLVSLYVGKGNGKNVLDHIESEATKFGVPFEGMIGGEDPEDEILEESEKHDMLVFSRGYPSFWYKLRFFSRQLMLGDLEREVIAESQIPMIVVNE